MLLTAAQLVGAVATVVIVVTHVLQGHAVPVGAFKLLQRAGRQRGLAACKGHNRRGGQGVSHRRRYAGEGEVEWRHLCLKWKSGSERCQPVV